MNLPVCTDQKLKVYHATDFVFDRFALDADRTGLGLFFAVEFEDAERFLSTDAHYVIEAEVSVANPVDLYKLVDMAFRRGVFEGLERGEASRIAERAGYDLADAFCRADFGVPANRELADYARSLGYDSIEHNDWIVVLDDSLIEIVERHGFDMLTEDATLDMSDDAGVGTIAIDGFLLVPIGANPGDGYRLHDPSGLAVASLHRFVNSMYGLYSTDGSERLRDGTFQSLEEAVSAVATNSLELGSCHGM